MSARLFQWPLPSLFPLYFQRVLDWQRSALGLSQLDWRPEIGFPLLTWSCLPELFLLGAQLFLPNHVRRSECFEEQPSRCLLECCDPSFSQHEHGRSPAPPLDCHSLGYQTSVRIVDQEAEPSQCSSQTCPRYAQHPESHGAAHKDH